MAAGLRGDVEHALVLAAGTREGLQAVGRQVVELAERVEAAEVLPEDIRALQVRGQQSNCVTL